MPASVLLRGGQRAIRSVKKSPSAWSSSRACRREGKQLRGGETPGRGEDRPTVKAKSGKRKPPDHHECGGKVGRAC